MADTRVIMVGGRRCGKSSILASMLSQMGNNADLTTKYIQMNESNDPGDQSNISLTRKLNDLVSFITGNMPGRLYLVDFHADDNFNHYIIKGRIPNGKGGVHYGNIKIEFIDCPGESFDPSSPLHGDMIKLFQSADTYIVVIDTPYVMDSKSDPGKCAQVNQTTPILSLFQQNVMFKGGDDFKKVIFVPVKCEKWENKIDEVTKKIQQNDYYGPLIHYLSQDQRFSISIVPTFTAGSIEFAEFGEPMITTQTKELCSPNMPGYRFADGKTRKLTNGDSVIINDQHQQWLPFYSWFKNKKNEYLPKNCDQLALHIWRFIIYKTKVETDKNLFPNWLHNFPSINNLLGTVINMQKGGFLKDSGNGIHNVRLVEKI